MNFAWRPWIYQTLISDIALAALLPQSSIFGAGSIKSPPKVRPFLVIKMDPEIPGPFPGVGRGGATLWAHDEPGDYMRLDSLLSAARAALGCAEMPLGQVAQVGAIGIRWQGDSQDLSDSDFGTIVKTSTYELLGEDGNG